MSEPYELVWVAFVGWARFPADVTEEEIGLAAWNAAACAFVAQAVNRPPNFEGLGFEVHAVDQRHTN